MLTNFLTGHLAKLRFVSWSWLIFKFCLDKIKNLQLHLVIFSSRKSNCVCRSLFSLLTDFTASLTQHFQSLCCNHCALCFLLKFFLQFLHLRWCGRSNRLWSGWNFQMESHCCRCLFIHKHFQVVRNRGAFFF